MYFSWYYTIIITQGEFKLFIWAQSSRYCVLRVVLDFLVEQAIHFMVSTKVIAVCFQLMLWTRTLGDYLNIGMPCSSRSSWLTLPVSLPADSPAMYCEDCSPNVGFIFTMKHLCRNDYQTSVISFQFKKRACIETLHVPYKLAKIKQGGPFHAWEGFAKVVFRTRYCSTSLLMTHLPLLKTFSIWSLCPTKRRKTKFTFIGRRFTHIVKIKNPIAVHGR